MTGDDAKADDAAWEPADAPSGPEAVPPAIVAAGMVVAVGLAAIDVATGGILGGLLDALPDASAASALPETIEGTSAPIVHRDGTVACTRCGAAAAYATMTLNEHGYFCPSCGPSQPR